MKTRISTKFFAFCLLAASLEACGSEKVYVTADSQKTAAPGGPEEADLFPKCTKPADCDLGWDPAYIEAGDSIETVDSKSFADSIAQRQESMKAEQQVAPANPPTVTVSIPQIVKVRFLEAQAANPSKFSVQDALRLSDLVASYADSAQRRDVIGAYLIYQNIGREVARIKSAQSRTGLGLYDNSTFSGRILNFGNGIIDVFAQFYGSLLALDPTLAVGAGESLVRNITHLLTF
jgi:hypothetical protein